jgi:hypothetical protein
LENVSNSKSVVASKSNLFHKRYMPSRPKRTPPNGLPNATEIPAAAAAARIVRFCAGYQAGQGRSDTRSMSFTFIFSKVLEYS